MTVYVCMYLYEVSGCVFYVCACAFVHVCMCALNASLILSIQQEQRFLRGGGGEGGGGSRSGRRKKEKHRQGGKTKHLNQSDSFFVHAESETGGNFL